MNRPDLTSYIIKGGEEGRARLAVISRVLDPAMQALLDRFEPLRGRTAIDAGCGGGDVTFEIAKRVGPEGRVTGLDLDDSKLALAREEAVRQQITNVEFRSANIMAPWPVSDASLVNVRFVVSHLANPNELLQRAREALEPGGTILVTDIDYGGHFCDPPSDAIDRYRELYVQAAQRGGGNPYVGRSLARLLESAGFVDAGSTLVQPYGRSGEVKEVAAITLEAIRGTLVSSSMATHEEITQLIADMRAFTQRPDTTMSFPRIFQAWARKP
jgi:ubiquinone/menaquinone biosynthesis C-methylase UbiE